MEIKYFDNDPYYSELLPEFRIATFEDFYDEGKLIINKPYLIQSMIIDNIFWAKRTKLDFMNHNDFYSFLEEERIFVLK